MITAQKAKDKTMKNGRKNLHKSWWWIKYFIKDEIKDCNYKTSYGLGESTTKEVVDELRNRLEKLGYVVEFDKSYNRIYITWN
jgi:hypothetical protein